MKLYIRIVNDDYIAAAASKLVKWSDEFTDDDHEDSYKTKEVRVPYDLGDMLLKQGTMGQVFSDGYEAYDVLKKYLKSQGISF